MLVATHKPRGLPIHREFHRHRPSPAPRHLKHGQVPLPSLGCYRAKGAPVHLPLLTGICLEPHHRRFLPLGSVRLPLPHPLPQPAAVASLPQFSVPFAGVVYPCSHPLLQVTLIRPELAFSFHAPLPLPLWPLKCPLHDFSHCFSIPLMDSPLWDRSILFACSSILTP